MPREFHIRRELTVWGKAPNGDICRLCPHYEDERVRNIIGETIGRRRRNHGWTTITARPTEEFVVLATPDFYYPGSQFRPGQGACGSATGLSDVLFITEQQARSCNNLLKQKAAAAGLTCDAPPV